MYLSNKQTIAILLPTSVLILLLAFCAGLYVAGRRAFDRATTVATMVDDDPFMGTTGGDVDVPGMVVLGDTHLVFDKGPARVATDRNIADIAQRLALNSVEVKPGQVESVNTYSIGHLTSESSAFNQKELFVLRFTLNDMGAPQYDVYYTTDDLVAYSVFTGNTTQTSVHFTSQPVSWLWPQGTQTYDGIDGGFSVQFVLGAIPELVVQTGAQVILEVDGGGQVILQTVGMGGVKPPTEEQVDSVGFIMEAGTRSDIFPAPLNGTMSPLDESTHGMLYRVRPDKHIVLYDVLLGGAKPFWKAPMSEKTYGVNWRGSAKAMVSWTDGKGDGQEYFKARMGACGIMGATHVVDSEAWAPYIRPIGTTIGGGEKIYGFGELINLVNATSDLPEVKAGYQAWRETHGTEGLKEFFALRPFFVYKDALGRWVLFTNSELMPVAECGG